MYKKEILSNGLRIVTHNIKNRESVAIGFWIAAGGRYENDQIKGAAHFLEHVVFKGSKRYSCKRIKESIEGVGGLLNAFTSEEQTCFFAKTPAKHLEQTFDVLSDMVFDPKITASDVENEKGVIVEEIKMYHDLPQYYVLELLDALIWKDHPLGKNLAGTEETVLNISNKDLRKFHRDFYVPSNIVVAVCGNVDTQKITSLVDKKLGKIKRLGRDDFLPFDGKQDSPKVKLYTKDIEQMHVAIGFPGLHENHKDKYLLELLSVILGGNMSSRLFAEIREKKGLAYSISSSSKSLHDTGLFLVRAGVDNRKVEEAISLILKELEKLTVRKISQGEFVRGKDYLLGQLLLGLEDTMDHMLWIGESLTARDKLRTLNDVIHSFSQITIDDLRRVSREVFDKSRINLSIVGPLNLQLNKQIKSLIEVA